MMKTRGRLSRGDNAQCIHLGLLVTVHVDAVVLFHAMHELFHENPEF